VTIAQQLGAHIVYPHQLDDELVEQIDIFILDYLGVTVGGIDRPSAESVRRAGALAENGWVNYNSLQQLMYFTIVFIAAPLAAITGVRMSEWWPKNAKTLNRVYPAPVARALHFPTMLFFVLFTIVHVFLVFATGALKNLNHMFAGTDTVSWAGFWWFAAGLVVTVGVTVAARPLVLAPIAGITGKISNR